MELKDLNELTFAAADPAEMEINILGSKEDIVVMPCFQIWS